MNPTPKEIKSIVIGLKLYKAKLKKAMKQNAEIEVGEREVKQTFLETEALLSRIMPADQD